MNSSVLYLQDLVNAGGPEPDQYPTLKHALLKFNQAHSRGDFDYYGPDLKEDMMGKALSLDTMQGLAYRKPNGYAGDFEVLERIYGDFLTPQADLKNWDQFWNSQAFVSAFQHSQRYFVDVMAAADQHHQGMNVLNIASGSSRSVADYLGQVRSESSFLCMDQSWKALDYASLLCRKHTEQVGFKHGGVQDIEPGSKFDLIWSEGLFDYLNDAAFKLTLEKLISHSRKGSEIVITNFSTNNPSQEYMDFLDWYVNPRSEAHMTYLATCCGIKRSQMHVVQDPSKVNMYLHIAL